MRVEDIGPEIVKNRLELLLDVEIPLLPDLLHPPLLRRILRPVFQPEIIVVEHAVDADAIAHRLRLGLALYAGGTHRMPHGNQFLCQMLDRAFASTDDMRRVKTAEMEDSHGATLNIL